MKIGKPCHFRPSNRNESACGIVNPIYAAYDARDCDCLRCQKTKKYKVYMGIEKYKAIKAQKPEDIYSPDRFNH